VHKILVSISIHVPININTIKIKTLVISVCLKSAIPTIPFSIKLKKLVTLISYIQYPPQNNISNNKIILAIVIYYNIDDDYDDKGNKIKFGKINPCPN
jgi:hypothetical protein